VLDGHEVVLQRLRLVLGLAEQLAGSPPQPRLSAAAHLGETLDAFFDRGLQRSQVSPGLLQEGTRDAVLLLEHGSEQVLREQLRVAVAGRNVEGLAERLLALRGHPIRSHHAPLAIDCAPLGARAVG
jgi:hypothetical protein